MALDGVKMLVLTVGDAGDGIDYDHADWADARIVMKEGKPEAVAPVREPAVVLTPKPSPEPRINGARVVGVRPGSPFLFTVPATGEKPDDHFCEEPARRPATRSAERPHHRRPPGKGRLCRHTPRPKRERHGRTGAQDRLRRHHRADAADGLE